MRYTRPWRIRPTGRGTINARRWARGREIERRYRSGTEPMAQARRVEQTQAEESEERAAECAYRHAR